MQWALAALTLVVVAVVCRRILHMDEQSATQRDFLYLRREREEIYQPVALEVETQTVILGISLNEALGEREKGHTENAWRLVGLAVCQWERLAANVTILLNAIDANISSTRSVLRSRNMDPHRFKSRTMVEFVRMRDVLDQLVFRSKIRYQMNIRVLRRAVESLTSDFRKPYRLIDKSPNQSSEIWDHLDPAFHDFDLIIKETLLSFRTLVAALPDSALEDFARELANIVSRSVRSRSAVAAR